MIFTSLRTSPAVRKIVGGTVVIGAIELTTHLPSQGRSSTSYHALSDQIVVPLMRRIFDPEVAHHYALEATKLGLSPKYHTSELEKLVSVECTLFDNNEGVGGKRKKIKPITFSNPIGLAAGFDKDGVAIKNLCSIGFGHIEIGTVTPQPQPGNPKPRMFRLVEDCGIINRYGFNSTGSKAVEENLKAFRTSDDGSNIVVGVNVGKNKWTTGTENIIDDYVHNIQCLGPYADYIVINISSPNTPNLRDLQKPNELQKLVTACKNARNSLAISGGISSSEGRSSNNDDDDFATVPPLLVKLAPDLSDDDLESIASILLQVDGVIVSNTTNDRPSSLLNYKNRNEKGGLSGLPVKEKSTECIRKIYALTNGAIPIIGVGGVGTGNDVYEKLKAGASIVQVYSMMIYNGPGMISRIRNELADIMIQNGHKSISYDIVGRDHEKIFYNKKLSNFFNRAERT